MSVMRCDACEELVDEKEDAECLTFVPEFCVCERCRVRWVEMEAYEEANTKSAVNAQTNRRSVNGRG